MKKTVFFILISILISCFACKQAEKKDFYLADVLEKSADNTLIITNKIMYDVSIYNDVIGADRSKNNPDWFWENLPEPDRENFVHNLMNDIKAHNLHIYRYDMTGTYDTLPEIPELQIDAFLDSCEIPRFGCANSDSEYDTIYMEKIDFQKIKKLRFLEEWYIKDGEFRKKVIAVAPVFCNPDENKEKSIISIHFWVRLKKIKN